MLAWDLKERKITIKLLLNREGHEKPQYPNQKEDDISGDEEEGGTNKDDDPQA